MKTLKWMLLALAVGLVARAEEKPDPYATALAHIEKAKAAIAARRGPEAVAYLQRAIGALQTGLGKFFPRLEGLTLKGPHETSGTSQSRGQAHQWHNANGRYEGENVKLTMTISSSPTIVKGQRAGVEAQLKMLQMLNQNPNMKIEAIPAEGGWTGWIMEQTRGKGRKSANMVAVHKSVTVMIATQKGGSVELVRKLWAKVDKKGLAEATAVSDAAAGAK